MPPPLFIFETSDMRFETWPPSVPTLWAMAACAFTSSDIWLAIAEKSEDASSDCWRPFCF
eukprot:4150901-Prymnesium_polylepis.1